MARIASAGEGNGQNESASTTRKRSVDANERTAGCTRGIWRNTQPPRLITELSGPPRHKTGSRQRSHFFNRQSANLRTSAFSTYIGCSLRARLTTKGGFMY